MCVCIAACAYDECGMFVEKMSSITCVENM